MSRGRKHGRDWWKNRTPRDPSDRKPRDPPSSSTQGGEGNDNNNEVKSRLQKRKVAILFGYSGRGYQGLQKNPGAKTIEDELENALLLTGCIPADVVGNLQKLQWQRCARTDKGVGALFQLISLKMTLPAPMEELPARINAYLPPTIRIFGIERVSKGFSSKNACNARTYEYMLPTSCLFGDSPVAFTEAHRERLQLILNRFLGSHKFHNFTSGRPWWHESSRRVILSYTCSDPFVVDGIEFVTLTVKGNSFVLHHIRKMTALIVVVFRDDAPLEVIEASFQPHPVAIPMAPAVGLILRQCHFDQFFRDRSVAHLKKLDFPELVGVIDRFKLDVLMPEMVTQIREGGEFEEWIKVISEFPIPYQQVISQSREPPPPMPSKEVVAKKNEKLHNDVGGAMVRAKTRDDHFKKAFHPINPGWENGQFEPLLKMQSLNYHFGKIYKTSIAKLNTLTKKTDFAALTLEQLARASSSPPAIRLAAGDIFCHQLYWTSIRPVAQPGAPEEAASSSNALLLKINAQFGSFEQFQAEFNQKSLDLFGSGWVWLCCQSNSPSSSSTIPSCSSSSSSSSSSSTSTTISSNVSNVSNSNESSDLTDDPQSSSISSTHHATLEIISTPDSTLPPAGLFPLLNIDLWEHAYYNDFRNERLRYLQEFWWPCVDWHRSNQRFLLHFSN